MEGWDVYRELFDELLETAESDANSSTGQAKLFIIPEWTFDILHEFVYQFQGFCQFRTTLYASANKHNLLAGEPNPKAPHHVVENVAILKEAGDVWNVETVYQYLSRLVAIGTSSQVPPAYQYFGVFASVALSRLECLCSDYTGCVQAMAPILENAALAVILPKPQLASDQEEESTYLPKSFPQIVHSVFAARISLTYHAGISFLMLRRYKDAIAIVGELCSYMQRGFKVCVVLIYLVVEWSGVERQVVSQNQNDAHTHSCFPFVLVDGPTPQAPRLGSILQEL
jgi:translation initiation factor 3 subunit L